MPSVNFCHRIGHHIAHPLSEKNIKLKNWEKNAAYAGLTLLIFGIVPGFIAFYGLSFYFKNRHLEKLKTPPILLPGGPKSPKKSINPEEKLLNFINNWENIKLPPPKPPKLKSPLPDPTIYLDDIAKGWLASANLADITNELNDYLPTLYEEQKDLFFRLFVHALSTENHNLISACLSCLDKSQLENFLKENNLCDFELRVSAGSIRVNRALLSAKFHYFERLCASGMSETQNNWVNFSEYSLEAVAQALDCLFFDSMQITGNILEQLLNFANCYGLEAVTKKCDQWILKNIDNLDSDQLYELTVQYDLELTINALAKKTLWQFMNGEKIEERKLLLWLRDATELNLIGFKRSPVPLLTFCKNLKSLNLRWCNWVLDEKNTLLKLRHLTELETLDLAYCPISDISALVNFPKLRSLNLSGRTIDNGYYRLPDKRIEDISVLEHLVNLEELDLSECFEIVNYNSLKKLTKLKKLQLPTINDLSPIEPLLELRELSLWDIRRVKDSSIISRFTKLEKLKIGDEIKDIDFSKLTNLRILICQNALQLNNDDFSKFKVLKKLTTLHLSGCKDLTDVSVLRELKHLKRLSIHDSPDLEDLSPVADLKHLEKLSLSGCKNLRDFLHLSALTKLRKLRIIHSELICLEPLSQLLNLQKLKIKAPGVADISPLSRLTKLETLDLSGSEGITDISALASLINLKILLLANLKKINDLSSLGQLTLLRHLNLHNCRKAQNFSFLSKLKKLRFLNLEYCQISDLIPISNLNKLQHLNIYGCNLVKDLWPIKGIEARVICGERLQEDYQRKLDSTLLK